MENPEYWTTEKWEETYKNLLTFSLSDVQRFNKAIQIYGAWNVYEAIVSSSLRKVEGDPINYVLAVAHANWKKIRALEEESIKYEMRITMAKERTLEQADDLTTKIRKAKRKLDNGK